MNIQEKAQKIYLLLSEAYGQPIWKPHNTPIDELILTILSANTNDKNSGGAFRQLKEQFNHDWDEMRTAPLSEIKKAIYSAGMYNQKAPRIVKTLEYIKTEQGHYNLEHLAKMSVSEAQDYLTRLPGVGHKTASIVLLFCFNMGAFPVDTHVQRITQRTGISPNNASPIKIKALWEELLPPETYYPLHVNLIRHGRKVCQARIPLCQSCSLREVCDHPQQIDVQ